MDDAVIAKNRKRGSARGTKSQPGNGSALARRAQTNSWLSDFGPLMRNTDRLSAHRLAQFALIITVKLVPDVEQGAGQTLAVA